MFSATWDVGQLPLQHSFCVHASVRYLPADQADYHHQNERGKYLEERANWLSFPVDEVLAHERLEVSPSVTGHSITTLRIN